MTLNFHRTLIIVVVGISIQLIECAESAANTESTIETTTNKQKDSIERFFRESGISLSIDAAGAHFKMRRSFFIGNPRHPGNWPLLTDFTLSKPDEIFFYPDNHASMVFTVIKITTDTIVLSYKTRFNHSSFGKNLITEDEGELVLRPFTNK